MGLTYFPDGIDTAALTTTSVVTTGNVEAGTLTIGGVSATPATTTALTIQAKEVTFTETTGAGTYTGSITVPAGSWVLDVIVQCVAVWNTTTTATLNVGDAGVTNGYFVALDLKATDLVITESVAFGKEGGKGGAYLTATHNLNQYAAAQRVITGTVVTVGAAGTLGRTRMCVIYANPTTTAATKA